MQGDKLFPRTQDVVGSGIRLGAPDRRGGDGVLEAAGELGQPPAGELGDHGFPVRRPAMRKNVDQLAFHPRRLGMPELDAGELLQMLMQEPGVIDDGLQDQRLAAGNGGAVAAMDRTCRQLRARDDIGLPADQSAGTALAIRPVAGAAPASALLPTAGTPARLAAAKLLPGLVLRHPLGRWSTSNS